MFQRQAAALRSAVCIAPIDRSNELDALQIGAGRHQSRGDGVCRVIFAGNENNLPAFSGLTGRIFDLIVANPPYIGEAEFAQLEPELTHEPRQALISGPTGLECYEQVIPGAVAHLSPAGWLAVEIGATQSDAVQRLFAAAEFRSIAVCQDVAGLPRVVAGER